MVTEYRSEHSRHAEHARHGGPSGLRPARAVVTGAAGFIGSHLVDALLDTGVAVVGIDNLDPWYDPDIKLANLAGAMTRTGFTFHHTDLAEPGGLGLLAGVFQTADVVFHLAGRPGVQDSWGAGFEQTCRLNVAVTQSVFEAALLADVDRVVYASSSSVYGGDPDGTVAPVSPYGVSKLAGEHLADVYRQRGLDTVTLRYFTVFGPRQRPDMAFHRLFAAAQQPTASEREIPTFVRRGRGTQRREFTFVSDVVAATVLAGTSQSFGSDGPAIDIGGGVTTSLNDVIHVVEQLAGRAPRMATGPAAPGDPAITVANIEPAGRLLGWRPQVALRDGLVKQLAWHKSITASVEPEAARQAA